MHEGNGIGSRDDDERALPTGVSRLGEYLVERGYVTATQLTEALAQQRAGRGTLLGQLLVQHGLLTEEALGGALADIAGVPFRQLRPDQVQAAAVQAVPRDIPQRRAVVPVGIKDDTLLIACADPFDILAADEIERRTGLQVQQVCVTESDLRAALERHYGGAGVLQGLVGEAVERQQAERASTTTRSLIVAEADATANEPIVRLVDEIINQGVRRRATDIHIDPEEDMVRCRYRIDGMLHAGQLFPKSIQQALVSRLKVMAGLDIAEQRLPQEGHITHQAPGQEVDLRVASFPTVFGEKVALRLLERAMLFRGLPELGLQGSTLANLEDSLRRSKGIVLLTGPTGSGKTTTLYTMLSRLDMLANNIVTLEDPVEYRIAGIRQSQINVRSGFTFATGLRSILRQDPDVVLLGEIRDPETAALALRAALTGVLVLSTLHTNEAAGTFPRLVDMGLEPYLIGSTMVSSVAERLVRKVCPHCAEPIEPDHELLEQLGLADEDLSGTWRSGRGCRHCNDTGFIGRTGIFEILMVTDSIRDAVKHRADTQEVRRIAMAEGMTTLPQHGLQRIRRGETTLQELARVARE